MLFRSWFAIDGKDETAWGIDAGPGRRNVPRKAVFTADRTYGFTHGTIVTFKLTQNHGGWNSDDHMNNNLGRFRLSVAAATNAVADPIPARVREIIDLDAASGLLLRREQRNEQGAVMRITRAESCTTRPAVISHQAWPCPCGSKRPISAQENSLGCTMRSPLDEVARRGKTKGMSCKERAWSNTLCAESNCAKSFKLRRVTGKSLYSAARSRASAGVLCGTTRWSRGK